MVNNGLHTKYAAYTHVNNAKQPQNLTTKPK